MEELREVHGTSNPVNGAGGSRGGVGVDIGTSWASTNGWQKRSTDQSSGLSKVALSRLGS